MMFGDLRVATAFSITGKKFIAKISSNEIEVFLLNEVIFLKFLKIIKIIIF